MSCIAIITARGGSKRIPHKNIRPFCGKPILAYTIEAALRSGVFEEVMVSTDDEAIAEVARQYGAAVPFLRSEQTSGDFVSSSDAVAEVLHRYAEAGRRFDVVANLYPTAPFVTAERLRDAVDLRRRDPGAGGTVQFSAPAGVPDRRRRTAAGPAPIPGDPQPGPGTAVP